MKKLIILIILAMLLLVPIDALAVAYGSVGPTTNFSGDVGVPSGKAYYINGTLLALSDITTAGLVTEAMLKAVNEPADEDIFTYESTTGDFEWQTPAEIITAGTNIDWDGTTLNVSGLVGNLVEHFMDVNAADVDYVHGAITGTGVAQDVTTAITNPDFGRNITVTSSAGSVGVVTITGGLANGTLAQTDAITIVDGGTASGVKAFVTVTNINVSNALINPETVTIGIGDLIGLTNAISAEADIYNKVVDGVNEFDEINTKANTTNGTLDCTTIVQNEDITVYYHQ
jgi:hypothetical protein